MSEETAKADIENLRRRMMEEEDPSVRRNMQHHILEKTVSLQAHQLREAWARIDQLEIEASEVKGS